MPYSSGLTLQVLAPPLQRLSRALCPQMSSQGCPVPHHPSPQPSSRLGCFAWGSANTTEHSWPQNLRYFWPCSSLRAGHQEANIVCWQKAATHGIAAGALQSLFFSFIPPESALDERSAATHECSEALKQIAGSTLSVLDISSAPRAHAQLREGSRAPLYKGWGAALEHREIQRK